jgi:predicted AlkP superfamily phosphohydrolase/phosphomutase
MKLDNKQENKKVLAIALDAAEPGLIEKWIADGSLINLASLRSKGTYGRLSSSAEWLAGSPWPTFYTGTLPSTHGLYHYVQWKSDKMEYLRPGPAWINAVPFWRKLADKKIITLDIPLTFPPTPITGIEISGWASHDGIYPPLSFPKEKLEWVKENFGESPVSVEMGGLQTFEDLKKIKDELIDANQKVVRLFTNLLNSENWDLAMCCFSSTHRGGHKLWDTTNVKNACELGNKEIIFKGWLKEIYESCDESVGKILESINDDVSVLIFSLHGMGANSSLAEYLLPSMVSNILSEKSSLEKENFIKKIRKKIPLEWRSNFKKILPLKLQDKITAYWRMGGTDWNKTKAFNLIADLQGYIRINLKGREMNGIVEDGEEYDQLCNKIIEGLKTFKDNKTGEPIIEAVERSDNLFERGPGFDKLPDILVKWKFKPVAEYIKIVSSEFGEVELPSPGKNLEGRSGNHHPDGFLIAVGENFRNPIFEKKHHIIDLAPTILNLLNVEKPIEMEGKSIISDLG